MSDAPRIVILDADGVFLDERPYWNAALAAALDGAGLASRAADRWDALADHAFGPIGLQRVTKRRGCNSNWDLAAVLDHALERPAWRESVDQLLGSDRELEAMQTLAAAANAVWRASPSGVEPVDPLCGFGLERDGARYAAVVERFQRRLHGDGEPPWRFARLRLRAPADETRRALEALVAAGLELRVCTGRHRSEIVEPIRALGLAALIDERALTTADDVDLAEARSGRRPLGKPHWFAPAVALVGFDRALRLVVDDAVVPPGEAPAATYVGDAWADFLAVERARARGLPLDYVHVRSGVTTAEQERHVAGAASTLGVVEGLAALTRERDPRRPAARR